MRWFRWIHLCVVLAVVCVVGVFSLSDSIVGPADHAPSILRFLARQLAAGNGMGGGFRQSLPFGGDTIMHFVGWSGVGFLAAGLLSRFADRMNLLLGLVTLSGLFEVGQRYLTSSRSAELTDLMANGTGLLVGFTLFAIVERTVGALISDLVTRTEALIRRRFRFT